MAKGLGIRKRLGGENPPQEKAVNRVDRQNYRSFNCRQRFSNPVFRSRENIISKFIKKILNSKKIYFSDRLIQNN